MNYSDDVYLIGLTGGSGSGKTLISDVFARRGIPVIDADKLAREIVEPGKPCLKELADHFGSSILDENGALKRRELARIAFSDPEKLDALNRITHYYIDILMRENIERYRSEGKRFIVFDAPVLIEGGFNKLCDAVVCVLADKNTRIERIMNRDSITHEEAERRIGVQHDDEFYISNSDHVIRNDLGPDEARIETNAVINEIMRKGGAN
ncbi:MAG: dephospho-CoA kinase [Clostridia bacterium]|nr:dephospho-CoA kinase [Clostridia bacterium]